MSIRVEFLRLVGADAQLDPAGVSEAGSTHTTPVYHHMNREITHHGAEVVLIRGLYRWIRHPAHRA